MVKLQQVEGCWPHFLTNRNQNKIIFHMENEILIHRVRKNGPPKENAVACKVL